MPELFEWFDRLKFVEREFRAVSSAVGDLRNAVRDGKLSAPNRTTLRDLDAAFDRLEPTYLIRLWAEFETAARSYYASLTHDQESRIRAVDLINTVAAVRPSPRRCECKSMAFGSTGIHWYMNVMLRSYPCSSLRLADDSIHFWGNFPSIGTDHPAEHSLKILMRRCPHLWIR